MIQASTVVTEVQIEYECCSAVYTLPTSIPDMGSALRHSSTVDTITYLADIAHNAEHPECGT